MNKIKYSIVALCLSFSQLALANGQIICPNFNNIKPDPTDATRVTADVTVVKGNIPYGVQLSGDKAIHPVKSFIAAQYAQGAYMCVYSYVGDNQDVLTLSNYDMVGSVKAWHFMKTKGTLCKATNQDVHDCVLQSVDY